MPHGKIIAEVQTYKPRTRPKKIGRSGFKRKKGKRVGPKPTSLRTADKAFSKFIRERDGKCLHPAGCARTELLQCSHYYGRAIKNTRFDPENCITLCWLHHYKDKMLGFEYQKQQKDPHGFDGGYTIFMKHWLGAERFDELSKRAKIFITQKKAISTFMDSQERKEG